MLDARAGTRLPARRAQQARHPEKISTRVRLRPKFEEALRTAREVKAHAPHCRVILTMYEMKRLGRDGAELTALADHLTAHGLVLERLAGPLPGVYDPTGPGKPLFALFAAMPETERENIRASPPGVRAVLPDVQTQAAGLVAQHVQVLGRLAECAALVGQRLEFIISRAQLDLPQLTVPVARRLERLLLALRSILRARLAHSGVQAGRRVLDQIGACDEIAHRDSLLLRPAQHFGTHSQVTSSPSTIRLSQAGMR
ncbi:recombinase family protein [Streptomyces melanogenes]|uniref:recombinase family protein n=1 Tax=Streptomyces melanogenes TaxID=67326 RepID=UPI0037B4F439